MIDKRITIIESSLDDVVRDAQRLADLLNTHNIVAGPNLGHAKALADIVRIRLAAIRDTAARDPHNRGDTAEPGDDPIPRTPCVVGSPEWGSLMRNGAEGC